MCQDAGNIMVALNPFAYGEGNLKNFRYMDGHGWDMWVVVIEGAGYTA